MKPDQATTPQHPDEHRRPVSAVRQKTAARSAGPTRHRRLPLLDWLAEHHPNVFGDPPRPLKRGIFEDLLAAHPGELDPEALKPALAQHTRSTRYLSAVGEGQKRRNLQGETVESPTPEQVHHALVEVFRRRAARSDEDLRPRLRERIARAFEASGLDAMDYAARVSGRDEAINTLTQEALAEAAARSARLQALQRAYATSGQSLEGFAAMYGLSIGEARRALGQKGQELSAPPGT
ncbi:MAG TPA: ProQ/FINO family protein [Hydrogenophaga sp.]|uniref:ProQ/FINO family protein n=1 Tax=Hydrogenophaga sp. TaxID=1904254 RepID=UPI002C297DEE|nr:ProQ/FINO family protein [Hydrogenophaga sp.]HMN92160.1 ProQ/FINO family protein [Hydrogenophaga sp.]